MDYDQQRTRKVQIEKHRVEDVILSLQYIPIGNVWLNNPQHVQ